MKTTEREFKMMTEQLRLTSSDEDVANYLRWIIESDTAKEYWQSRRAVVSGSLPLPYTCPACEGKCETEFVEVYRCPDCTNVFPEQRE